MKFINIIIIFFLFFFVKQTFANENKILFKINNHVITSIDIKNEINYLRSVNNNFENIEKEKIFQIARNSIIKNKIREIFLLKIIEKIELEDIDYNNLLVSNYSQVGINELNEIDNYLKRFNVKKKFLRNRIATTAIWNQIIYDKYSKYIKIDINEIKKSISKDINQKEFYLYEILFNLQENEKLNEKFKIIKQSIKEKNFKDSALIYSISDTSSIGGDLGWIGENSISKVVLNNISNLEINEFSEPITVPGGFLILQVADIRIAKKDINIENELQKIIKIKTNQQLNQYSNIFFNKVKKDVIINEF